MNNQEYWSRRFEDLKNEQMKRAELTAAQLKKLYEQALRDAQDEVLAWYQRYARENSLSLQEARKQLDARELKAFRLTLEEFKRLAKQKNLSPEYRRMLDNASIRVRLDRNQALMIKLRDIIEKLAKEQQVRMEEVLKKTYEDSYYKAAYETQKVTGYAPLNGIQEETVRKVLSKPWAADGRDFSARIWGQRDTLVNALQIEVTRCLISHKGTGTMAKRIAKRFNTSFANASRLVETEVAYFQERGRLDTFAALGVEQIRLLAVLDNRTSETCQELDGKIVALKDAEPGVTTPPFHCYCRTTIVPVSEFDTEDSTRAARDPLTGKTVSVPGDLTYKEWYNEYVKGKGNNADNKHVGNFESALQNIYNRALKHGHKTGTEGLFWINKDGSDAFEPLTGTSNRVVFTHELIEFLDAANEGTLHCVHNHPGSSSFSIADLSVMCRFPAIDTMYVIGHDGTEYTCSVCGGKRVHPIDIESSYRAYQEELRSKYTQMYANGATQKETWKEHSNEIVEKIAKQYDWKYTRKSSK